MSVGTAALVVGAATAGYAANQAGKSPTRSMTTEGTDTLASQVALAPDVFRARSSNLYGDPAYARLNRQVSYNSLFGGDGAPGLIDTYGQALPQMQEIISEGNTQQRQADIADIAALGPEYQAAARGANPQLYGILDMLSAEAQGGTGLTGLERGLVAEGQRRLGSAGEISPDEVRQITQDVRGDWNDRGLARSNAALVDEALNLDSVRRQRRDQDLAFAGTTASMERAAMGADRGFQTGTAGLLAGTAMDPVLAVTGRQSMAINPALAQQAAAQGYQGATGGYFNPWNSYAQNLYGMNNTLRFTADQNEAEAWGGFGAGLMNMAGGFGFGG